MILRNEFFLHTTYKFKNADITVIYMSLNINYINAVEADPSGRAV